MFRIRRLPGAKVYSPDGVGNNPARPTWGSAGSNLLRISGTAYGDGVSSMAGDNRPAPRVLSNVLGNQAVDPEPNARTMSDMVYAWGQFIDHDLDLTPPGSTESAPIDIPAGDPVFPPGTQMPFSRATWDPATGKSSASPRQQPNTVTAFLDGSMVYGSDAARAAALRTFSGGKLKTSDGDLLPFNDQGLPVEIHIPGTDPRKLFLAGDVRVNENSELAALTVLFVREHNFWAARLASQHPTWSDEQLFQGARSRVIAEIQSVTYREFLPALLGAHALPAYRGYDPKVNPAVSAEFSAAAYRAVGHTLVNQNIDFFKDDGSESHAPLDFNAAADNPAVLQGGPGWAGAGVDNILKYLSADNAQEVDNHFENALRNQLFAPSMPAAGGLDLYAIDVQRGRDLGLPDYNTVREAYGLPRVTSFEQITANPVLQKQLADLYGGDINNLDLMVGGLSEDHLPGSSLGPTFGAILTDQFKRTRDGDRLWFENALGPAEKAEVEHTTLVDIIRRNSGVKNLQQDVFVFSTGTIGGRVSGGRGVQVELLDGAHQPVAKTVTGADGTYHFDKLKPGGTYEVRVTPPPGDAAPAPAQVSLANNSGAGEFNVDFELKRS